MIVKNYKQSSLWLIFLFGTYSRTDWIFVCTVFKTAPSVPFKFHSVGGCWDSVVSCPVCCVPIIYCLLLKFYYLYNVSALGLVSCGSGLWFFGLRVLLPDPTGVFSAHQPKIITFSKFRLIFYTFRNFIFRRNPRKNIKFYSNSVLLPENLHTCFEPSV